MTAIIFECQECNEQLPSGLVRARKIEVSKEDWLRKYRRMTPVCPGCGSINVARLDEAKENR